MLIIKIIKYKQKEYYENKNKDNVFLLDNNNNVTNKINKDNFENYKDYINVYLNYNLCLFLNKNEMKEIEIENKKLSNNNNILWVVDSGATKSIVVNKNILTYIRKGFHKINLVDNTKIITELIGDYVGYINNMKVIFKDVIVCPVIFYNVVSVNDIINNNLNVNFSKNELNNNIKNIFNNESKNLIMESKENGNLFFIKTTFYDPNLKSIDKNTNKESVNIIKDEIDTGSEINYCHKDLEKKIIHYRFGHPGNYKQKPLEKMIKSIKILCISCFEGKETKNPNYKNNNRAEKPFQLIHMDLIGPINVESRNGNKYILVIVDDFSRYLWTLYLKNKSETWKKYREFIINIKKHYNEEIYIVHSDNGTEFTYKNFEIINKIEGINHIYSIPYTPQMNGRVERVNRCLMQITRCLLFSSKLNLYFWEDAMSYATLLSNIQIHITTKEIPYNLINKKEYNNNKIRIWGCKTKFLKLNDTILNKLDTRTTDGYCIGMDKNNFGYKLITKDGYVTIRKEAYFQEEDIINNNNESIDNISFWDDNESSNKEYDNNENLNSNNIKILDDNHDTNNLEDFDNNNNSNEYDFSGKKPVFNYKKHKLNILDTQGELINDNLNNRLLNELDNGLLKIENLYNIEIQNFNENRIPKNLKEALQSNESEKWINAIMEELNSFKEKEVYEVVKNH